MNNWRLIVTYAGNQCQCEEQELCELDYQYEYVCLKCGEYAGKDVLAHAYHTLEQKFVFARQAVTTLKESLDNAHAPKITY